MKILLVTSRSPFPARRGDQLRALQAIELLGGEHELTLLSPRSSGPAPRDLAATLVEYEPAGVVGRALGVARAAFLGEPLQSGLFRSRDLGRKLRALAPAHDLAILQLERLVGHLDDLGETPVVVDLIDSLALNLERRADYDRALARPVIRWEAARLAAAERRLAERARRLLVVAERDRADLAGRLPPELSARIAVVPLAIEIPTDPAPPAEEAPTLAITGNLGYFPTVDGATWFLTEVWPRLRASRPGVRLVLAGDRPARRLRATAARAGVELIEAPPDLRELLRRATLALAPLRAGSGVPVKILEAWALGVPVLATPWAAAGTPGRAGDDLAVAAAEPQAWLDAIGRLLDDPIERAHLAANGRATLAATSAPAAVGAAWRAAVGRERATSGREPLSGAAPSTTL